MQVECASGGEPRFAREAGDGLSPSEEACPYCESEIEPTIFVAVSFLAMFAFMFGDVGHGLVLLVTGLRPRHVVG